MTNDPAMNWAPGDMVWMSRHLDQLQKAYQTDCRKMLFAILDVLETVSRSREAAKSSELPEEWQSGFASLELQLQQTLKDLEVEPITAEGFVDPNVHDVIEAVDPESTPDPPGTILRVLKPGYLWKGQLLRATEVVAVRREASESE